MNGRYLLVSLHIIALLIGCSTFAVAQAPEPVYSGSFGGGFAVTGGNTDTTNFNLAFELLRDPKTRNRIKVTALYLRGSQNDVVSLDRGTLTIRDEYTLSNRAFLFGQADYLRDQFKEIRYLIAPVAGFGYKLVNTDRAVLSVSAGAGGVWEKNFGRPVEKSGSLTVGQSFSYKLSSATTITQSLGTLSQSVGTLWKTNDLEDSFTNFSLGLSTSLTRRLQLKIEFIDSFKNKPANASIKRNDTALVTTFGVRF
jgi:putative salt-induced outer membrane protein